VLKQYKILIDNAESKGFKGKLDINKSFLAYVEDEEREEETLRNKAIELIPELKDMSFSLEPIWELKKEGHNYNNDRFTDKIYVSVDYDTGEWEYEPLDYVDFALFYKKYKFINTVPFTPDRFESWEEMERFIMKEYNPVAIIPVSLHDHGGLVLLDWVERGWDTMQIGYMFISRETANRENLTEEQAKKLLKDTFDEYAAYVQGECYIIDIFDLTELYKEDEMAPIETISILGYDYLQEVLEKKLNEFLPERLQFKKDELLEVLE
jgi:hypothetical protein